jgi:hypothetical protein
MDHQAYALNSYQKENIINPYQKFKPNKLHFNSPTVDAIERIFKSHRSSLEAINE